MCCFRLINKSGLTVSASEKEYLNSNPKFQLYPPLIMQKKKREGKKERKKERKKEKKKERKNERTKERKKERKVERVQHNKL